MSNYTKSTNFATKDNLTPGDPLKIVRGTEIDTEYNNIATAIATKTDNASAAITGGAIDGATVGATTPATGAFTTLAASGTTTLAGALVGAVTQAAFNTVSTTLNLGGAATAVNLGAATGTATVNNTTLAAKAITASTTLAVTGTSTLTGAVTATAGVSGPITSSSVSITGGSITGITDLAIADGGTGASTANNALNNLLPSQTGNANKYLQSDGTNATWDAVSLSTADITGTLGAANGGTGVSNNALMTVTGSGNFAYTRTLTGTTNVTFPTTGTLATLAGTETLTNKTLTSPILTTPTLGVATATSLQGIIGNVTPAAGSFTTLGASSTLGVTGVATFSAGTAALPALTTTGDTNTGIFFPAADTICFSEGGLEAMRIDSAGNVGIGITPSAWFSSYRALVLGYANNGMFSGGDVQLGLTQNAFLDSGVSWRYTTSNPASQYIQINSAHQWFTAPSGTAGNAISFTQAMTLDASGNLGIGTTSPAFKLDVVSTGNTLASNIASRNTTSGTGAAAQILVGNDVTADLLVIRALSSTYTSSGVNVASGALIRAGEVGGLTLAATDGSGTIKFTAGGATEGMRLTSTGLGIGNSSPIAKVDIQGGWLRVANGTSTSFFGDGTNLVSSASASSSAVRFDGDSLLFSNAATELMRLNSSGNLGIGTSPAAKLHIGVASAAVDGTKGVRITNAGGGIVMLENGSNNDSYVGTLSASDFNIRTNNTERVKFPNAGGVQAVTTISVGNATPSASGAGITFPATQSASSDANTLDDYEEGTWTPTATPASGSITSYTSVGNYTKIGNIVFAQFSLSITNGGTASSDLTIGALPFSSTTLTGRTFVALVRENSNTGQTFQGFGISNNTTFVILGLSNGNPSYANGNQYTSSFCYQAV